MLREVSKSSKKKSGAPAVYTGGKVAARLSPDHYDRFNMLIDQVAKREGQRPAIAILVRQMVEEGIDRWCKEFELDEASLKRWRSKSNKVKIACVADCLLDGNHSGLHRDDQGNLWKRGEKKGSGSRGK